MEHVSFRGDKVFAPLMNSLRVLDSIPLPLRQLLVVVSIRRWPTHFSLTRRRKVVDPLLAVTLTSVYMRYVLLYLYLTDTQPNQPKNQTLCHFTMCLPENLVYICKPGYMYMRQLANWLTLIDAILCDFNKHRWTWADFNLLFFISIFILTAFSFIGLKKSRIILVDKRGRWRYFGERSSNCKLQSRQLTKISFA